MAGADYTELDGNGCLIEAAKKLMLFRQLRDKPANVTKGHVEYAERVARHLVRMYRNLENLPADAQFSIFDDIQRCSPQSEEIGRGVLDEMEASGYRDRLDAWHLQMSVAVGGAAFVLAQVEGDGLGSVADVVAHRLEDLLGSTPFP